MTKRHALIILGIIIAIVPFSGIPDSGRTMIVVLAGLAVVVLSYVREFTLKPEDKEPPQA